MDGRQSVGASEGDEGGYGGVGGGKVGELKGATAESACGVLARGEEGDDGLTGGVVGEGVIEEGEGVEDPVTDPWATGVQGAKACVVGFDSCKCTAYFL